MNVTYVDRNQYHKNTAFCLQLLLFRDVPPGTCPGQHKSCLIHHALELEDARLFSLIPCPGDDDYWLHNYPSTLPFTPQQSLTYPQVKHAQKE